MNEKLKPCPFCGGEVKKIYYSDGFGVEYFGVHCERCRFTYGAETEYKRNTVNRWNRRMTDWIKTSERLPEENQCVLVVLKFGFWKPQIFIGCISNLKLWSIYGFQNCFVENEIPYWMPLPEPPEKEETGGKE